MRRHPCLGLLFLVALAGGCGNPSATSDGGGAAGGAGSSGSGGSAGSGDRGGSSGTGGAGASAGRGGATGSGGAGGAAGAGGAGGGLCATDDDCAFHTQAGCCGMCLARTDTVPPTILCGANCLTPPSCLCIEGRCREGTQTSGTSCDLSRSECGRGLLCCQLCSPVGAGCDSPRCSTATSIGGLPMCLQPA